MCIHVIIDFTCIKVICFANYICNQIVSSSVDSIPQPQGFIYQALLKYWDPRGSHGDGHERWHWNGTLILQVSHNSQCM